MSSSWHYVFAACVLVVPAVLFFVFPLEFVKAGIGQEISFLPVSWATRLSGWYWKIGIRYDCSNISLFGFRSSFSNVVPALLEETKGNLVGQVTDERVAYVAISDRLMDFHQRYIEDAARLNTDMIRVCGLEAFLSEDG